MQLITIVKKIWNIRWAFSSLPKSFYFNFHYLPFHQAIHLPILFRKVNLLELKGNVKIYYRGGVKFGMIRLGQHQVSIYPDAGFTFENHGGTIIFNGPCSIGANSAISIGSKGKLEFGERFNASTSFRIACYDNIKFESQVRFGWDCIVMDTDFHSMKKLAGGYSKGYGPVHIGRGSWIGTKCMILKNTTLPAHTTVAAGTKVSTHMDIEENCIIGQPNQPIVLRNGIFRNHEYNDDKIIY